MPEQTTPKRTNRRIVLAARPHGEPKPSDFRLEELPQPEPRAGEMLLRICYLSLDPYMRGRMNAAKSYAEPVALGDTMVGSTIAEVVASQHPGYAPGDFVLSYSGWQTYALSRGEGVQKLDPKLAPLTTALGVLGMPGLTAHAGLLKIGKPQAGETVVVAAATGPVGSVVGQIAKLKGCHVVGIAGGAKKCRALKDEFGFDRAVDHRSSHFAAELAEACPRGIDVYFENVGGAVLEAVLPLLNDFARVPVCGLIAHYNDTQARAQADHLPAFMAKVLTQRLAVQGFIVTDYLAEQASMLGELASWVKAGKIRYREDIVDGLVHAPTALIGLLQGKNFGKMIVKVGSD